MINSWLPVIHPLLAIGVDVLVFGVIALIGLIFLLNLYYRRDGASFRRSNATPAEVNCPGSDIQSRSKGGGFASFGKYLLIAFNVFIAFLVLFLYFFINPYSGNPMKYNGWAESYWITSVIICSVLLLLGNVILGGLLFFFRDDVNQGVAPENLFISRLIRHLASGYYIMSIIGPFLTAHYISNFSGNVVVYGFFMISIAGVFFYMAKLLSNHKCRRRCLAIASVGCLAFPFGTIIGVITLIILSRDSARQIFDLSGKSP